MYYAMSRGDQRDDISLDDVDRPGFIKSLAEACQKTTLSAKQIAERPHLGRPKGARTNLHKFMNGSQSGGPQIELEL